MFKIGKVLNHYSKIGVTIVFLTGGLAVGDKVKIYKDGKLILFQKIDRIIMNQKDVSFAKPGDVIGLHFVVGLALDEFQPKDDEKIHIQKGSEVFRLGQLGA